MIVVFSLYLSLRTAKVAGNLFSFSKRKKLDVGRGLVKFAISLALNLLGFRVRAVNPPSVISGALVSNHLGYMDILVISEVADAIFVSKAEVEHWPLFGTFTKEFGTLFLERRRKKDLVAVMEGMRKIHEAGRGLVFFPEGTSSGGKDVKPFKTSLFEIFREAEIPLGSLSVRYEVKGARGSAEENVCYWKDHRFFPHLIGMMGLEKVEATVRFGPNITVGADRKETAKRAWEAVNDIFRPSL